MKLAIIDNEPSVRETIERMLEQHCPNVDRIFQATGVKSGVILIREQQPDLVLLDMEMDDGTGLDLLRELPNINFQLVFITAHEKYALNAIKMSAIDFLLKPIDADDLVAAVAKASRNIKSLDLQQQIQVLKDSLISLKSNDEKIVLRDSESIHFVRLNDIVYCEADGPYTTFHLINKEKIIISRSLKEFDELLDSKGFIRTHKSYVANITKIVRFDKLDGGTLVMDNGMEVPVSQRKKDEVMNILNA